MQNYLQSTSLGNYPDRLKQLYQAYGRATEFITSSLLTDLNFLYTPSQIALAAFFEAAPEQDVELEHTLDSYLTHRCQSSDENQEFMEDMLVGLKKLLDHIRVEIRSSVSTSVNKSMASGIANKLKLCMNPEMDSTRLA